MLARKSKLHLDGYDYSENGYYFITVCSRNRENIFGECENIVGEGLAPSGYFLSYWIARINRAMTDRG